MQKHSSIFELAEIIRPTEKKTELNNDTNNHKLATRKSRRQSYQTNTTYRIKF